MKHKTKQLVIRIVALVIALLMVGSVVLTAVVAQ